MGGGLKPSADTQHRGPDTFSVRQSIRPDGAARINFDFQRAFQGIAEAAIAIHNGDVLTVRQLPGWNDLGASISVKGEVRNPGTYGIRPGEKLSSILERAGGFQPDAYAYGAVLRRVQVRELEAKDQDQMILRVKDEQSNLQLLPESDPDKKKAKDLALQQWQTALEQLSSNPPTGRVSIRISADIDQWQNTAADVDVRAGDSIEIPKKPSYVMVTGQVYQPDGGFVSSGKECELVFGAIRWADAIGEQEGDFCDSRGWLGAEFEPRNVGRRFPECGIATWRHRSCSGEGYRRRRAMADGVPGRAGGVIHREHGIHSRALLVRVIEE